MDAILKALAAGFNDKISDYAAAREIEPFTIDFTPDSTSFALAKIDESDIELCDLLTFPAGCLYTDEVESSAEPHGIKFNVALLGCLDFYIRARRGIEGFDDESLLNLIEYAAVSLMAATVWPIDQNVSVIYSRRFKASKSRQIDLGDGVAHKLSIQMQFNVFVK